MSPTSGILLAALVVCVALSAFFSSSETAFSAVNKVRLKAMSQNGNGRAKRALNLAEDYDRLLTTILVGNNVVNIAGTSIAALTYILYYIGLSGSISTAQIMAGGEASVQLAFERLFGRAAGVGLFVLVVVSCLGTLNGLMLAATRGLYAVAARGCGPRPEVFRSIDPHTNMPANAAVVGVLLCAAWLTYFYGANLAESWFGPFGFDSSELPIITLYALYIPMFLNVMRREKELCAFHRYVMPALSIACCIFFCAAAVVSHGKAVLWYLIVFAVIMAAAIPFYRPEKETG